VVHPYTYGGKMARKSIFVGTKRVYGVLGHWKREVYRSSVLKSEGSPVNAEYDYLSGPFKTVQGAKAAVHFGWVGNPHFIDAKHFERLVKRMSRKEKKLLARLPNCVERV
jgi:hypothetical protein